MAEEPTSTKKRRVKNPESFRERAVKAAAATDKPKRRTKIKGSIKSFFARIFGPLGKFFKKLFKVPPFSFIAKLFKWIGYIVFPVYLRNSWKELKFVTWPNFKQSKQLTFAVLIFAIVFGTSVALVDIGLDKIFKHILLK